MGNLDSPPLYLRLRRRRRAGTPLAEAFAPLGSNLLWVAYFKSETQSWLVYNPSGSFSPDQLQTPFGPPDPSSIGELTHMVAGNIYTLAVDQGQSVTLGGKPRNLTTGVNYFLVW